MTRNKLLIVALALCLTTAVLARSQGVLTACKSNLKNIGTALEMYSTDYKGAYPPSLSYLTPNYLRVLPKCPVAGSDTYSQSYVRRSRPDWYAFYCSGYNHNFAGVGPYFPGFDAGRGLVEREMGISSEPCARELEKIGAGLAGKPLPEQAFVPGPKCTSGQEFVVFRVGEKGFQVCCPGVAHVEEGLEPFQPCYDSQARLQSRHLPPPPPPAQHPQRRGIPGWVWGPVGVLAVVLALSLMLWRR